MTIQENIQQCLESQLQREKVLINLLKDKNYIRRKQFDRDVKGTDSQREYLWNLVYQKSDYFLKKEITVTQELIADLQYLFESYNNE